MRDKEFLEAMSKLAPILSKRFHFLAKKAGVMDDRKSLVEDLVSLTILEALLNSRKEIHLAISCEQLIRTKARNVWAEYWKQRKTSFNHADHEELELHWKEDASSAESSFSKEKIESLLKLADPKSAEIINLRMQGFAVKEIAEMYGQSEGSITMQIQRLKQKINERP